MDNGKSTKYKGGILLSTIFVVGLLSMLLLIVIENTRISTDFSMKTIHFYQARIMKELFLTDYQNFPHEEKGKIEYNVGILEYEEVEGQLMITSHVAGKEFQFIE